MIFVTTGTQEPFDRLIIAIDEIAAHLPDVTFKVQAFAATYKPKNFKLTNFFSPAEFETYVQQSQLIISHAGMGTIISALVNSKPIIVMPRLMKYLEHRNEHQLATAKRLDGLKYVTVAYDAEELISTVLSSWPDNLKSLHKVGLQASEELLDSLNNFIKQ